MKYATLCKKAEDGEQIEELIDAGIESLADTVRRLRDAYPDAGLGDTACGQAIRKEVYEAIHYKL